MIKSMTGFASIAREDERATVAVTIRALNHRYLDLQLRVPQSLAALESDIRALVSRHVARGRVELSISLQLRQTPGVEVEFNDDFGRADEAAVAQEIVRMAARSDISEEVARFRAHVSHWVTLADSAEPCGRKLDFLLQEMNREVNTMGSKADGLRVSELIIAGKAELEKMREQVQNVE